MKDRILEKKIKVIPSSRQDYHFIDGLNIPAVIYLHGRLLYSNNAFQSTFSEDQINLINNSQKIQQIFNEIRIIKDQLSFEVVDAEYTLHCIASPIQGDKEKIVIFFEDISLHIQTEKDNALLYRLSLLLSSTGQPLKEKLQTAVDQILFEMQVFDCSLMLFDKKEGRLYPVAWGTTDLSSSITRKSQFALGEWVAGHVALTLKPVAIPNVLTDPRFQRKSTDNKPLTLVCIPMISSGELFGVICVSRKLGMSFNDKDVQLFSTIASRLAPLIESDQAKQEELLQNQLVQLLSSSLNITEQFGDVLQIVSDLLQVDQCYIYHCSEKKELSLAASYGGKKLPRAYRSYLYKTLGSKLFRERVVTKQGILFPELFSQSALKSTEKAPIRSTVIFPLVSNQRCSGLMIVQNTKWERAFADYELKMGASIAAQISVATENTKAHEEVLNERRKLQQIQNTLRDGVILFTPDMKILMHNDAARRILGIKKDIIGLSWSEVLNRGIEKYCKYKLIRYFDPKHFAEQAVEQGKVSSGLAVVTSNPARTLEIMVGPVYDRHNQVSGILSHFRDITQLHDLQTKMAERVKQLTYLFRISSIGGLNTQQIVQKILTLLLRLLAVKASQLLLLDAEREQLKVVESGGDQALLKEIEPVLLPKVQKLVTRNSRAQVIRFRLKGNNRRIHGLIRPIFGHHGICIGALVVADKDDGTAFLPDEMRLLSIVGVRIANKLDNAWLIRQVERDREKLETIIDQSVDGILVTDADNKVQIWNKALERLSGVKEETVKGQSVDFVRSLMEIIEYHEAEDVVEVKVKTPNKRIIWLGIAYAPIVANHRENGYVAIVRDISRQKELELAKSEFISTASHELRSPLTAIVGYLSMLRRGDAGHILNKQQGFFVDKAYQNAKRMVDLVEDLLTTTRMEAGRVRYHIIPINYRTLMESIISDFRFKAEEKSITITLDKKECATVLADPDGLHQIISNLLNNAIKYTPYGGKVTISFQRDQDNDKPVITTCITDSGVGIDAADQEKIFDKFARGNNPLSVNSGGAGLGLYITRTLIEELGGKIWVKSKKGEGSTFYFSLPLAKQRGKERKL